MQHTVLPSTSNSFIMQEITVTMRRLSPPNVVVAVAHFHTTVVAFCRVDVDQVHDDDRVAVANVRILLLVCFAFIFLFGSTVKQRETPYV
jgi:hypothetical protein